MFSRLNLRGILWLAYIFSYLRSLSASCRPAVWLRTPNDSLRHNTRIKTVSSDRWCVSILGMTHYSKSSLAVNRPETHTVSSTGTKTAIWLKILDQVPAVLCKYSCNIIPTGLHKKGVKCKTSTNTWCLCPPCTKSEATGPGTNPEAAGVPILILEYSKRKRHASLGVPYFISHTQYRLGFRVSVQTGLRAVDCIRRR